MYHAELEGAEGSTGILGIYRLFVKNWEATTISELSKYFLCQGVRLDQQ